jgi:hypothetical protein
MRFTRLSGTILVSLLVLLAILITSCTANPATMTVTSTVTSTSTSTSEVTTASTTTTSPGTAAKITVTVTPPPVTVTITPAPSTISSPAIAGTDLPTTAKFFTGKEITSYIKSSPRLDGSYDETPVYSDKFFELKEIARFVPVNATFVPRIPSITTHDDWFVRFSVPTSMMKPWLINYGYTLKPGDTTTTLDFSVYTQSDFNTYYYDRPHELDAGDMDSGDRGTSLDGSIHARMMQDKWGDFVIFWRTNNAANVTSWWVRIGVEGP